MQHMLYVLDENTHAEIGDKIRNELHVDHNLSSCFDGMISFNITVDVNTMIKMLIIFRVR